MSIAPTPAWVRPVDLKPAGWLAAATLLPLLLAFWATDGKGRWTALAGVTLAA